MSLRVVNGGGSIPSIGQSLIRNLVRPFEAFGLLGIFLVSSTEKAQRIGDLLASTYVVRTDELKNLATVASGIAENQIDSSREVIPITSGALELAKTMIAGAYKPDETGLSISANDSLPNGLAVQLDFIDASDDCWHYTTDGVTVAVPRKLADHCNGLQVVAQDGKLVVDRAT